jgi:two-component system phosphate regulon response regulator PhoB
VRVDRARHLATIAGRPLEVTLTEFRLLECFLRQPGRAFTRPQLVDAASGDSAVVLERTIDVHIKSLRRKLGSINMIETVRSVGYRFREAAAASNHDNGNRCGAALAAAPRCGQSRPVQPAQWRPKL